MNRPEKMPKSLNLPNYSLDSNLDSQQSTILISWYTLFLHFLAGFYFLDVSRGSASDFVLSPVFEYSSDSMCRLSLFLAIYSFLYMVVASLSLIKGVKSETRIYYFPWFILTGLEIVLLYYQVFYSWKYSYDADTVIMAMVLLIFTMLNTYLYSIVISNYRYLKRIQSPTIIFPEM